MQFYLTKLLIGFTEYLTLFYFYVSFADFRSPVQG